MGHTTLKIPSSARESGKYSWKKLFERPDCSFLALHPLVSGSSFEIWETRRKRWITAAHETKSLDCRFFSKTVSFSALRPLESVNASKIDQEQLRWAQFFLHSTVVSKTRNHGFKCTAHLLHLNSRWTQWNMHQIPKIDMIWSLGRIHVQIQKQIPFALRYWIKRSK